MALKFTYILGAGASAQALPLAKDSSDGKLKGLASRLDQISLDLEEEVRSKKINQDKHIEFVQTSIIQFRELADKSRKFNTIDTLAKFYYLKQKNDLEKLKVTLSKYFLLDQLYFKKRDNRYLVFLTTILERNIFPEKHQNTILEL